MIGKKLSFVFVVLTLFLVLSACGQNPAADEDGTLIFTANGEEFIREGFVSKDGWELTFEHAYLSLSDFTAYITNPAYSVEQGWDIDAVETVVLPGTFVVDLAASDADPSVLGEVENIAAGHYNAISWTMSRATEGDAAGYMMVLVGTAEKDGLEISFVLRFEEELLYRGGEYIGDERKGIVTAGGSAEVEATFHFDHLFGDGEEAPTDEINVNALGFEPFAAFAQDGALEVTTLQLAEGNAEAYERLRGIYLHFGHVGEGHGLARFR